MAFDLLSEEILLGHIAHNWFPYDSLNRAERDVKKFISSIINNGIDENELVYFDKEIEFTIDDITKTTIIHIVKRADLINFLKQKKQYPPEGSILLKWFSFEPAVEHNTDIAESLTKVRALEIERDTLLKLVYGMVCAHYGYDPDKRNTATGENNGSIATDLQKIGLEVSNETIRKYLKEAAKKFTAISQKNRKSKPIA